MRALLWFCMLWGCGEGGILNVAGNQGNETSGSGTNAVGDVCDGLGDERFCDGDVVVECQDGELLARTACDLDTSLCVDGVCEDCAPAMLFDGSGETLMLSVDGGPLDTDGMPYGAQVVTLVAQGVCSLTLVSESVSLLGRILSPLTTPLTVEPGQQDIYVLGEALGEASLSLTPNDPCGEAPATTRILVNTFRGLAGRPLADYPHFEYVSTFNEGEAIYAALDPTTHPHLLGRTVDVYLTEDRTSDEWAASPELIDVRGKPSSLTVAAGSTANNLHEIWTAPAPSGTLTKSYDVVYDIDQDGIFDSVDLIDGVRGAGLTVVSDLTRAGPLDPVSFEYSDSYWATMRIYAPRDIQTMSPLPLVVISHGNGHDYRWYDYLGLHLASWGYVVMSHRNDTVPGTVTAAITTRENTDVFLRDLGSIGEGLLDGKVDSSQITWIGHSRGGEGVVLAYDDLLEGDAVSNNYSWEDIQIVSSIAPVIFEGPEEADPHGVTYHLLAGSSDGDVTGGPNSSGSQYFRIFKNSTGDGLVTYVQGASHNDFNCCGANDGSWTSGPGELIGPEAAQATAQSYYLALLEWKIRGNDALADYFGRMPASFRPVTATPTMSNLWMPRADPSERVVIDNFQANADEGVSSSGGGVRYTVSNLYEGILEDAGSNLGWTDGDPMNGMTWAEDDGPTSDRGVVFDFDGQAAIAFDVPAEASDMRRGGWLSLRACQGTRHPNTIALNGVLDFAVILRNAAGTRRDRHGTVRQHPTIRSDGPWFRYRVGQRVRRLRVPLSVHHRAARLQP